MKLGWITSVLAIIQVLKGGLGVLMNRLLAKMNKIRRRGISLPDEMARMIGTMREIESVAFGTFYVHYET